MARKRAHELRIEPTIPRVVVQTLESGPWLDARDDPFPTSASAWCDDTLELSGGSTHFGFVQAGTAILETMEGRFPLKKGMYFSVPDGGRVLGSGSGLAIQRHDYRGFFTLGGPVETRGRLRYIDGCTDSLLLPPVRWGDPCLNLLCFPAGTHQTHHTHPSLRAGVVTAGRGECHTEDRVIPLTPGLLFWIPADTVHGFVTTESSMTVIAYHPDSDHGPRDDDHPMINRTLVGGVSAARLDEIRTTDV